MDLKVNKKTDQSNVEEYSSITFEDINKICRLCGNFNEQLTAVTIVIEKIREHLPLLEINEDDGLPTNVCYQCICIINTWHDLFHLSIDVEKRLKYLRSRLRTKKESSSGSLVEVDVLMDDTSSNFLCETSKTVSALIIDEVEFKIDPEIDHTNGFINTTTYNGSCEISKTVDTLDDFYLNIDPIVVEEVKVKVEKMSPQAERYSPGFLSSASESSLQLYPSYTCNVSGEPPARCSKCGDDSSQSASNSCTLCSDNGTRARLITDPRIPEQFSHFLKKYTNSITYMQCDLCTFICRPLIPLFLKHYQIHFTENTFPFSEYLPQKNKSSLDHYLSLEYSCHLCSEKFPSWDLFSYHLKCHERVDKQITASYNGHPLMLFKCDTCNTYFRSEDKLKYHRRIKCVRRDCQICHLTFTSNWSMIQHLKEAHTIDLGPTKVNFGMASKSMCFLCGKMIKDISMEKHTLLHIDEEPFKCDMCGQRFRSKSALRNHIMVKMGYNEHVCEICGCAYARRSCLNVHMRFHKFEDHVIPFKCTLCPREYLDKRSLRAHQVKEVICLLCEEIFISNDVLKQHVKLTHGIEIYRNSVSTKRKVARGLQTLSVYPCNLCDRRFTSEQRFQQHVQSETKCELCDDIFDSQKELKGHVKISHELLEYQKVVSMRWRTQIRGSSALIEEYTCDICGKKLYYRCSLKAHMKLHLGLKRYICAHCGKRYVSKQYLKKHLVTKLNLRNYKCVYCGEKYNFHSELTRHVKQQHTSKQ